MDRWAKQLNELNGSAGDPAYIPPDSPPEVPHSIAHWKPIVKQPNLSECV